jgi:hypothetical protein
MSGAIHGRLRLGVALYWVAFVCVALWAGGQPGFIREPFSQPYPWDGVLYAITKVTVLACMLYVVLHASPGGPRLPRLCLGLLGFGALALWEFWRVPTDMPGHYYVVQLFAITTTLAFMGQICLEVARASGLGQRLRNAGR